MSTLDQPGPRSMEPRPVTLAVRTPGLRRRPVALRRLVAALEARAAQRGWTVPPGELSVALLGEPEHAQLHADFCGDPSPTDVITFPGDPEAGWAGEICLSLPRAEREAGRRQHPVAQELCLYLVHGWLHLAGFDDLTPTDRRAMRRAERFVLAGLPDALAATAFSTFPSVRP